MSCTEATVLTTSSARNQNFTLAEFINLLLRTNQTKCLTDPLKVVAAETIQQQTSNLRIGNNKDSLTIKHQIIFS